MSSRSPRIRRGAVGRTNREPSQADPHSPTRLSCAWKARRCLDEGRFVPGAVRCRYQQQRGRGRRTAEAPRALGAATVSPRASHPRATVFARMKMSQLTMMHSPQLSPEKAHAPKALSAFPGASRRFPRGAAASPSRSTCSRRSQCRGRHATTTFEIVVCAQFLARPRFSNISKRVPPSHLCARDDGARGRDRGW